MRGLWGAAYRHFPIRGLKVLMYRPDKRRGSGFKVEKMAKAVTAEARAEQGLGPKRKA